MKRAFKAVKERQRQHIPQGLEEKIEKLKSVRDYSVGNRDMLDRAIEKTRENGFRVFMAENKDDAAGIVLQEIGDEKLVIKSKSNVSKEIGLAPVLERPGDRGHRD